jgi:uncharacterized membrane protein
MSTWSGKRAAQLCLTLLAAEFFGPALRDANSSHAANPAWAGHARFHVAWFIAMLVAAGVINLYLLWGRRPAALRDLALSAAWQGCTLFGFWTAVVTLDAYGGVIFDATIHQKILGIDENVLAFSVFTTVWVVAVALLVRERRAEAQR